MFPDEVLAAGQIPSAPNAADLKTDAQQDDEERVIAQAVGPVRGRARAKRAARGGRGGRGRGRAARAGQCLNKLFGVHARVSQKKTGGRGLARAGRGDASDSSEMGSPSD